MTPVAVLKMDLFDSQDVKRGALRGASLAKARESAQP